MAAGVYATDTKGSDGHTGSAAQHTRVACACSDGADGLEDHTNATSHALSLKPNRGSSMQSKESDGNAAATSIWRESTGVTVIAASAFVVYAAAKLAQRRRA